MKKPPPRNIGRFQILEELGQGSMGVVYRALDRERGCQVAVKTIIWDMREDKELRARFYLEADVAGKLDHPGIIRVHEVGEADGHLFLAMELLDGKDLKAIIREHQTPSMETRIDWMKQLAAAVAHAHSKDVIHRDIKPGNIHVKSNGQVVILDFGIARTRDSHITWRGAIMGTPEYISPEQVLALRVDHRADIFSLGLVFYELLTGTHPFRSKNLPTTVHRILNERPSTPDHVSAEIPASISAVVMHMLEKDVNVRYQSCSAVLGDLEAWNQPPRHQGTNLR